MKKAMKVASIFFLVVSIFVAIPFASASADSSFFTFSTTKAQVKEKDEVRITVDATSDVATSQVAGLRLTAQYDQNRFTLKRIDTSSEIESNTFRYYVSDTQMTGIYVCGGTTAPALSGNCFTMVFAVNQDAPIGDSAISVCVDQLVNWQAQALGNVSSENFIMNVEPVYHAQAVLTQLTPSEGVLTPAFESDISEYELNVDGSVSQIFFDTAAADSATVKVSRKNLLAMGSKTPVTITVTSSDGTLKTQYIVTVNRGEKEGVVGGHATASSKATATTKKTTSTATKSKANTNAQTTSAENGVASGGYPMGTTYYGDRTLIITNSEMPLVSFFVIVGCICVATALPIGLYFFNRTRKLRKKTNHHECGETDDCNHTAEKE